MGAEHRAAHDALRLRNSASPDVEPTRLGAAGQAPVMDLVAAAAVPASGAGSCPRRTRCRRRAVPAPRPARSRIPPLSSMRPAQHLESPADTQHRFAGPPRASAIAVGQPRSRSQARSATVALLPGSTIRSVSARSAGSVTQRTSTPGSQASASTSVELEIRGSRTAATRSHCAPRGGARRADDAVGNYRQRILGVQPQLVGVGQHPVGGAAGHAQQLAQPGFQQRGVAAEFVDDEAGDERLVVGFEHRDRPEQMRQQAAAVDVADQDHRQVRRPGQPHVGQIGCAQVDFGRRTGALADHRVEFARRQDNSSDDDGGEPVAVRANSLPQLTVSAT